VHKHNRQSFFVQYAEQQLNCLCGELFTVRVGTSSILGARWLCFDVLGKFCEKFCPLCYKQVVALSPRRIKDKFLLVFSKFLQIALVAARLQKFCHNFENTGENLSLILLGLMRLHTLKNVVWALHARKTYYLGLSSLIWWLGNEKVLYFWK